MTLGIRALLTAEELARLRDAMNWVIPADSSPGAGTDACLERLLALIESEHPSVSEAYRANVAFLTPTDLSDPANRFAALFIEHVRDVYYGYPESGSWADIGFEVTNP